MSKTTTGPEGVKIGDFFQCSWGYDQTNVDFYKVIAVTAKSVKIQRWKSKSVYSNTFQQNVVPGDGPETNRDWTKTEYTEVDAPIQTKRVRYWADKPALTMNSYSNAYLWDGTALYATAVGAGH